MSQRNCKIRLTDSLDMCAFTEPHTFFYVLEQISFQSCEKIVLLLNAVFTNKKKFHFDYD